MALGVETRRQVAVSRSTRAAKTSSAPLASPYRRQWSGEPRAPVLGRTDGTQMRLGVNSYEWVICPLSDDAERVSVFCGAGGLCGPAVLYLGVAILTSLGRGDGAVHQR